MEEIMLPRCALLVPLCAALALPGASSQSASDSEFLKKSAEDLAFLQSVTGWTKNHGAALERNQARTLLFQQSEFGARLQKLAQAKHINAPLQMNQEDSTNRSRMDGMKAAEVDRFFVTQETERYTPLIQRFRTEAQQGQDAAIRHWASQAVKTLQQQQHSLNRLKSHLG
jgi:hypothetical protein